MSAVSAFASSFTDAHGNVIELDDSLEAYTDNALYGANDAARKGETNLGDLWTDALRWFAVSGEINAYFDEDDVAAGNKSVAVDADHIVAIWNGGNLRDDLAAGKFGAEDLAKVLPYPNKVAVVYLTGAQLEEQLEAACYGMPYTEASASAAASFLQVAGLKYTVDTNKKYDKGEAYGKNWFKANSVTRVSISEVNGKALDKTATYALITSNAYFNGMDAAYVIKEAAAADERSTITNAVVRDVIWLYLQKQLSNRVGADYAQAAGRITIKAPAFSDVVAGTYYAEPVAWAAEKGVLEAKDGKVCPDADCSRAEVVSFLWKAAGSPEPTTSTNPFSDVSSDNAAYKAILWAAEKSIAGGYNGKFNPDRTVNRAEALTFLFRAAGSPAAGTKAGFSDAVSGSFYEKAVDWAAEKKVAGGIGNNLFAPTRTCNRAEILTFIYRCYNN